MSQALRLQIGAAVVLLYIIINYLSAKRRRTISHKMFTLLMICAFVNVTFDALFVYCVNVNGNPPDIINRFYLISLGCFWAVFNSYQVEVVKELGGRVLVPIGIGQIPIVISALLLIIFDIDYYEIIDGWFYGMGVGVVALYFTIAVYVIHMVCEYIINFGRLSAKMSVAFGTVYVASTINYVIQLFDKYNVITSTSVAFSVLCMFAIIENPDQLLIEQLKYEKDRANAANESKSSFIAHVSHEIRTPINAILGMNDMIIRDSKEPNSVQYAQDISTAANTLYSIINDVLDMSKMESGKMEIVPVNYSLKKLLYETISLSQSRIDAKQLDFFVEINTTLPSEYYGDDVRIKQILSNILSNAVKYTHEGFVKLNVDGEFHGNLVDLTFSIKDTGIGIKEEDFAKLFVAFERIEESRNRNIEGTGLGMNITNTLLKMMGSRLEVSSIYGEGSIFSFTITQRIVNSSPVGDYESYSKEQKNIVMFDFVAPTVKLLIVDDNSLNRRVFLSLLAHTQMQIDEASNGYECLEKIRKEQYDLIFLDHLMPQMDGIETIRRIKEDVSHPNVKTPVVMLTANAATSMPEEYKLAGFNAYLSKPIINNELEKVLRAYLPAYKVNYADAPKPKKREFGNANWREELPTIRGIDWSEAIKHLPTEEVLYATMKEFQKSIQTEAALLDSYVADIERDNNLELFGIKVHALKGSAAMIGAEMLAEGAKELETVSKEGNLVLIREKYPYMINYYRAFENKLEMFNDGDDKREDIDFPQVIALVEMVRIEMDDMNKDNVMEALEEIEGYVYPDEIQENIQLLRSAAERFDVDTVDEQVNKLVAQLRALRDGY